MRPTTAIRDWGPALLALALTSSPPAWAEDGGAAVHDLDLAIGVGYDSNPLLAASEPYFDQNSEEFVNPRPEPGFLVPIRLRGDLAQAIGAGRHTFLTEYRLDGDVYQDSALRNADEAFAKLGPGIRFDLGDGQTKGRYFDILAYASYKKDVYFDRDTGLDATVDGFDVSNRYEHSAFGAEILFDYELSRFFSLFFEAHGEKRDYEDPGAVESFDHDRYGARAGVALRLAKSARLGVDYVHDVREYSDRHARSFDGDSAETNPLLEYTYTKLTTNLRLRPLRSWTIDLRWQRRDRTDEYLDYNGYAQDSYRIRSTVNRGKAQWRLSAEYWERDFERAFIFDDPFNPATGELNPFKAYETVELEFEGWVNWKKHLRPFTRIEYVDQDAVDPRFLYERTQAIAGLELLY